MTGAHGGDRPAAEAVERTFRAESGRVLARLARHLGDLSLAEDAVQEAYLAALRTWPSRGLPDHPAAWILTTARHRALDHLRREARRGPKEDAAVRELVGPEPPEPGWLDAHDGLAADDDQLRLIFTCCHPALASQAQVALTLRLVCGLQTPEIARAFLQPVPTVAQRLIRAKAKVRTAGIPFRVPPAHLLPERVPAVLACIYLVFAEGYAATTGAALVRRELCDEGIRLARLVVRLMPDEAEARGLLALLLLQDSRRVTRLSATGDLVLLEDSDRGRWDRHRIVEGVEHLERALRRGPAGPYQLQAAVAAVHAEAPSAAATDWPGIAALYAELARRAPSPVVELNRAVAVAFAEGPAAGLAVVDAVAGDPRLARTHLLPATRADLLRRLGRREEAAAAYRAALALVGTAPERAFLQRRLAAIDHASDRDREGRAPRDRSSPPAGAAEASSQLIEEP